MTKENQRNIDAAGREVQETFLKFLRVCAANTDREACMKNEFKKPKKGGRR